MKNLLPILALGILLGCEKSIDYELPKEDPKLTIDSKILAGDDIHVFVGLSQASLSSEEAELFTEAEVYLYRDDALIDTLHTVYPVHPFPYFYASDHHASPGSRYRLEVHKDGYATAHGSTHIPGSGVAFNTEVEGDKVTVSFSDPPSAGDYYLFRILSPSIGYKYFSTTDPFLETFEGSFELGDHGRRSGSEAYLSDHHFNGEQRQFSVSFKGEEGREYTLELVRITAEYYEHEKTKAAAEDNDNIFSEPVQVYTNISNGYGIVAGGNPSRFSFRR